MNDRVQQFVGFCITKIEAGDCSIFVAISKFRCFGGVRRSALERRKQPPTSVEDVSLLHIIWHRDEKGFLVRIPPQPSLFQKI